MIRKPPEHRLVMLAIAGAALALGVGLGLSPQRASALPTAGMDQVIRPAFGELLRPPLRRFHPGRPDWRLDPQGYGWRVGYGDRYRGGFADRGWRQQHGYAPQGPIETITVDCGDPSLGPTPLADALDALDDGGTLYIRKGSQPCLESLLITRPVTLVGEQPSAFAAAPPPQETTAIAPPPGAPCLRIGPGVKGVEIRDLTFLADQAGRAACIESWDSDLALTRVHIRYAGQASALFASGGKLIVHESRIDSLGDEPAVAMEDASADFGRVDISAASTGVDAALASAGALSLDHVDITGAGDSNDASPSELGLMLRPTRGELARVTIRNGRVSGFKTGVWFQRGGNVEVTQSWIGHARVGVVSEGADLTLTDSAIGGRRTGVYAVAGRAEITRNRVFGFTDAPFEVEPEAQVSIHENWIYPAEDCHGFGPRFGPWCRDARDLPDAFRDHDRRPGEWGWEGAAFDYPPPPPPENHRHWWLW